MTSQTYRRARHSVSLRHAHLVFATKHRRLAFTGAMLTFAERSMRGVCAELNVELVSVLAYRLTGRTAYAGDANTPASVSAPACVDTSGRPTTSPSPAEAHPVDHQPVHRRTSLTTLNAGLRPPTQRMGSPRTDVRGVRPRRWSRHSRSEAVILFSHTP